jgi:hypothetical protein
LRFNLFRFVSAASLVLTFTPVAHATLGEKLDSIETDSKAMVSSKAITTKDTGSAPFTVHTITTDGSTVNEYAAGSGVVFAITWIGSTHPDLKPLLGTYSDEYEAAKKDRKNIDKDIAANNGKAFGTHAKTVKGDHVTVEKYGHALHMGGRAYDSSLFPSGVTLNDIQ